MSAFSLERLEDRQLFSAVCAVPCLVGEWKGTETLQSCKGKHNTTCIDVCISSDCNGKIELTGLPTASDKSGCKPLCLTGCVECDGSLEFSACIGKCEEVTLCGKVECCNGKTTLTFTESDTTGVGCHKTTTVYCDSLCEVCKPTPVFAL
jgi:hypothetical protein